MFISHLMTTVKLFTFVSLIGCLMANKGCPRTQIDGQLQVYQPAYFHHQDHVQTLPAGEYNSTMSLYWKKIIIDLDYVTQKHWLYNDHAKIHLALPANRKHSLIDGQVQYFSAAELKTNFNLSLHYNKDTSRQTVDTTENCTVESYVSTTGINTYEPSVRETNSVIRHPGVRQIYYERVTITEHFLIHFMDPATSVMFAAFSGEQVSSRRENEVIGACVRQ